ncbi:hypothetical protein [Brunnivagina elsteri]|nr:hypothetical protein [Calothrix elsteri]
MLRGSSFAMPLAITLCDRLSEIEIEHQKCRYDNYYKISSYHVKYG